MPRVAVYLWPMPTLAFFPWGRIDEPLTFGGFRLVPLVTAVQAGSLDPSLHDAAQAILEGYGHRRAVDRRHVILLQREHATLTGELDDDAVADLYAFRTRLTFASLAARPYFDHRYWNSESLQLVIRTFTSDSRGGVLMQHRRRDGSQQTIYPAGAFRARKPDYVDWCSLPECIDVALLHALEGGRATASASGSRPVVRAWNAIAESLPVFVRANTDSPAVDAQSELVDLMSAYSRLLDTWDANGTSTAFVELLPSSGDIPTGGFTGPRALHPDVQRGLANGRSLRWLWMQDAFKLRNQLGHGRVPNAKSDTVWSVHEHLLFGSYLFPVLVKARLHALGLYTFSADDRRRDWSFEQLLETAPFVRVPRRRRPTRGPRPKGHAHEAAPDGYRGETWTAWEATCSGLAMRFATAEILRSMEEREREATPPDTQASGNATAGPTPPEAPATGPAPGGDRAAAD